MPQRIQLSRKRGWRKPEGAIVVSRPSRWGNPFKVGDVPPCAGGRPLTPEDSVEMFTMAATGWWGDDWRDSVVAELRGHDLACWCPLDQPCHADVLLRLANA